MEKKKELFNAKIRLREVEEGSETTGGYALLLLFDFLLDVKNAEDAFCLGTDFAAACYNGEGEALMRSPLQSFICRLIYRCDNCHLSKTFGFALDMRKMN